MTERGGGAFEIEWRARNALNRKPRTFGDWLVYQITRFRAWRVARKQARCDHEVLGTACTKCGWPLRILNVYTPPGFEVRPRFVSWIRRELPPGVKVITVEGQAAHLGIVGFDVPPLTFQAMQSELHRQLRKVAA